MIIGKFAQNQPQLFLYINMSSYPGGGRWSESGLKGNYIT